MAKTTIIITNDRAGLFDTRTEGKGLANKLAIELQALAGGVENGHIEIIPSASAVQASGTVTAASADATNTCTVAGTAFTAVADTATPTSVQFKIGGVRAWGTAKILGTIAADDTVVIASHAFTAKASGATGDQFNIGADATATATALKNAINASVTSGVTGVVTATSSTDTVTITAVAQGTGGNDITLTQTGDHVTLGHVTAGKFTGGTYDNNTTAANLAAAINANTTTNKLVTAAAASAVVTITAITPGVLGNKLTLASSGATLAVSGAVLASGAGSYTTYSFGG